MKNTIKINGKDYDTKAVVSLVESKLKPVTVFKEGMVVESMFSNIGQISSIGEGEYIVAGFNGNWVTAKRYKESQLNEPEFTDYFTFVAHSTKEYFQSILE